MVPGTTQTQPIVVQLFKYRNIDMIKTELHEVFDKVDSVEMAVNGADFRLIRSKDSKTYVDVLGSPVFISKLSIIEKEGLLSVKCEQENSGGGNLDSNNSVIIAFGREYGRSVNASINGHGDVNIEVPFEKGSVSINGSGDIITADIYDFSGTINGSGDIKCARVHNLKIGINGCGDFDAAEVCSSFKATINGSGDINLRSGELQMFQAAIRGSGEIKAGEVTTQKANISVDGSGDIIVGRVVEESIEKHSKGSSIKILKRG